MAAYSNIQLNRMRQDAIRRSQEMHRQSVVNSSHYSQADNIEIPRDNNGIEAKNKEHKPPANQMASNKKTDNILGTVSKLIGTNLDSDNLTILALMFLLYKEGADLKLVLALAYVLL